MTLNLQTHSCNVCGEIFEVACHSELQEKVKNHTCPKVNKRVKRTQVLQKALSDQFVHDVAVDRLEQHNFNKLVNTGIIVHA